MPEALGFRCSGFTIQVFIGLGLGVFEASGTEFPVSGLVLNLKRKPGRQGTMDTAIRRRHLNACDLRLRLCQRLPETLGLWSVSYRDCSWAAVPIAGTSSVGLVSSWKARRQGSGNLAFREYPNFPTSDCWEMPWTRKHQNSSPETNKWPPSPRLVLASAQQAAVRPKPVSVSGLQLRGCESAGNFHDRMG